MNPKQGLEQGYGIPPETAEDLYRIARAFEYSRVLHVANNIDLFTILAGKPLTAEELADETGVEASKLEKFAIAAAALGMLESDGERFRNCPLTESCLVRGKPDYIGDSIWLTSGWWEIIHSMSEDVLRQYEAKYGELSEFERHQRFIHAMHDYASTSEAWKLAEAVDLSGRKRLLDLGGGPGTYSVFFCRRYPDLSATILDLPETEPVFREVVQSYDMSDRIDFVAGDIDECDLPGGYDCALVSNMMHGYRGETLPPKAFSALDPGGMIIVRDFILRPEKDGPLASAIFNLGIGAYSEDEMLDFLTKAGFQDFTCRWMNDHLVVVGKKP